MFLGSKEQRQYDKGFSIKFNENPLLFLTQSVHL